MNHPHKGKFITLEGGEGTGKSTQIDFLIQFLKSKHIDVIATREPGGSEGAELIRDLLVKGEVHRWDAVTEALLMSAARHDHLVDLIIPALKEGKWVLCDRFCDSTLAYQGYGHGVAIPELENLNRLTCNGVMPDITFIFDLDAREGLERARRRGTDEDRFERMDVEFHERIREGYRRLAQTDLNRYIIVDASKDRNSIAKQLEEHIQQRLL